MAAIDLVGKVDFVGAAAIVVGAARAHGKPERHGLQRPRLVAGNLEALDLRGNRQAVVANRVSRSTAALGQQIAKAVPQANQIDRPQQRVAPSEGQPRLVEPAPFDTLHGKRDRATRTDGIDPEFVASL